MQKKQAIAIGIALQTHLLNCCPLHQLLYLDDEVDPSSAFALAIELVRKHPPYAAEFHHDERELTDLISETLSTAPLCCPKCHGSALLGSLANRGRLAQSSLQSQ